jgi:transcriptional regulator with XRE-family HTH domain
MMKSELSLRKLATVLGVSQPFLSQIRTGKRPLPEALRRNVEALGAYHLLISDKQSDQYVAQERAVQKEKTTLQDGLFVPENSLAGVRGNRTHLPRSSRGITDLKSVPIRATRLHQTLYVPCPCLERSNAFLQTS